MYFFVYDADNKLRFESGNWPMARAALDYVISQFEDKDCPKLEIVPEKGKEP